MPFSKLPLPKPVLLCMDGELSLAEAAAPFCFSSRLKGLPATAATCCVSLPSTKPGAQGMYLVGSAHFQRPMKSLYISPVQGADGGFVMTGD
jgi:hypothetical protein